MAKLTDADTGYGTRAKKGSEKTKASLVSQLALLNQIDDVSEDIKQEWEDTLDIGKQLADNEKNIFKHKINTHAIIKKIKKAEADLAKAIALGDQKLIDYHTERKATLDLALKEGRAQNDVRQKVDATLKSHQKAMKPIKKFAAMIPVIGSTLSQAASAYSETFEKELGTTYGKMSKKQAAAKKKMLGMASAVKVVGLAIATYIGKNLLSAMQGTGAELMNILKRPEFIFFGAESRAIAEEFGNLESTSLKLGLHMKMMALFTGVAAENQAKIMGAMAATSDASLETLHAQMLTYRQAGVPFKAIMDDVAGNMEFTAKFAKDGGANIFEAAKRAKELGINLGDVSSISSSLLDFESSIEKQMEAQVLLGRNLNLDKARQLAFTGDAVGLQNEVMRLVGSEAEFNKMNYLQREALAGAIGLNVERLSALVRQEEKVESTASKVKWSWVAIGTAVGAIIGIIASLKGVLFGGMTFGKDMATMAKYTAGGAAAVGTTMGAISTLVPKMAEGGIINTPTLALIGEKGPEAVVPLAKGAGAAGFDMKKVEGLLERLIASSEKQVNRLGDIGTS